MSKSVLIIGSVFPEPTSSAAGWRMISLIRFFCEQGHTVHFASASRKTQHSYPLNTDGVHEHEIALNSSTFDHMVEALQPDIVMFDRYMTEEQYSWRVEKVCPGAIRILDTEDLHFLRKARQEAYRKAIEFDEKLLFSDLAKREVASILRSDLSLIISPTEYNILIKNFRIPPETLTYLPFQLESKDATTAPRTYAERKHFCFIGNFLHEPNWRTVLQLKNIWGKIRRKLPDSEIHIYGAYTSEKVRQLDNAADGFRIKDRAENAIYTLSLYRVLLAPIPFGAGQKGKFIDALRAGTPSITNSIGAEGMIQNSPWPGAIVDDLDDFCDQAIALYKSEALWQQASQHGRNMLRAFSLKKESLAFKQQLERITEDLEAHRQFNFMGQILWSNQFMANKYRSQWIEEKNKGDVRKIGPL